MGIESRTRHEFIWPDVAAPDYHVAWNVRQKVLQQYMVAEPSDRGPNRSNRRFGTPIPSSLLDMRIAPRSARGGIQPKRLEDDLELEEMRDDPLDRDTRVVRDSAWTLEP